MSKKELHIYGDKTVIMKVFWDTVIIRYALVL